MECLLRVEAASPAAYKIFHIDAYLVVWIKHVVPNFARKLENSESRPAAV